MKIVDKITSDSIVRALEARYPAAECALFYEGDPFRLLVMAMLSAQCTDARVNLVSQTLFARYPDAASMTGCALSELEDCIRSCGLYKTKAKNIRETARILCEKYGGQVPDTMEALLELPGVGRKIANLLLGDVFGQPGIVADTHCIRIAGRLGYYPEGEKNPLKTERILNEWIEKSGQAAFCHRLVLFGREICTARAPKCDACPLRQFCAACSDKGSVQSL